MESDKTPKALRICLTTFRVCISVAPDFRMATMLGITSLRRPPLPSLHESASSVMVFSVMVVRATELAVSTGTA